MTDAERNIATIERIAKRSYGKLMAPDFVQDLAQEGVLIALRRGMLEKDLPDPTFHSLVKDAYRSLTHNRAALREKMRDARVTFDETLDGMEAPSQDVAFEAKEGLQERLDEVNFEASIGRSFSIPREIETRRALGSTPFAPWDLPSFRDVLPSKHGRSARMDR